MTNKAFEFWDGLPGWAKGTIAVGGLAIVYFTGRGLISRIKDKANTAKEQDTVNQAAKDLSSMKRQGIVPSFSSTQYKSWADSIEKQFSGCDFDQPLGTTVGIPQVFFSYSGSGKFLASVMVQMKNDADVLSLVNAYGVRKYDQCGWFTGDFTGGLSQAISDELKKEEIDAINDILYKKKINFRF